MAHWLQLWTLKEIQMPYIEDEQEKQHREKWQSKQASKNARLDAAYNKLTQQQKDVLWDMWRAYDKWDTQTTEQFLLYETVLQLQSVHGDFKRAFPALTTGYEDD